MSTATPAIGWRIAAIADQALLVDFGEQIDAAINARVMALARRVQDAGIDGVLSLVPTYRALTVAYDSTRIRQAVLRERLEALLLQPDEAPGAVRCWEVPVVYGADFGEDLSWLAEQHGLSEQEVITLHSAVSYRVYMIGFMPGFAYLGGLDERLHTSRRLSPRLRTPAGSISIGGMQTAISSVPAPSGWHLIGRTPVRSFDPLREDPFVFQAGDEVRFVAIEEEVFIGLEAQADYLPSWTWRP